MAFTLTNVNVECTPKAHTEKYHMEYCKALGYPVIKQHCAMLYSKKSKHPKYSMFYKNSVSLVEIKLSQEEKKLAKEKLSLNVSEAAINRTCRFES